jgi:hypothetical protein
MRPLRKIAPISGTTPIAKAWGIELHAFRQRLRLVRKLPESVISETHFVPMYARPTYFRYYPNRGRMLRPLSVALAMCRLCANRGDPFAKRALAVVMARRLSA